MMYHISETSRCWTEEGAGEGTHFCCDSCVLHVGLHNSVFHIRHLQVSQVTETPQKKRKAQTAEVGKKAQTAEVGKKAVCTHIVFVHKYVRHVSTHYLSVPTDHPAVYTIMYGVYTHCVCTQMCTSCLYILPFLTHRTPG